jgi:hypothetical protein
MALAASVSVNVYRPKSELLQEYVMGSNSAKRMGRNNFFIDFFLRMVKNRADLK